MTNCIFCKIINKEAPAKIISEDAQIIAFEDIKPVAPIHILIIPKRHIPSVDDLEPEDKDLMGELLLKAKMLAEKMKLNKKGYKLAFNVGRGGGQIVDHLHLHLLGGWKSEKERNIPGMP